MDGKKILLGLTTTYGSDWREKTKEIDLLSIKEIALFPTPLELKDRKELYGLLEKTGLKSIPHVHIRGEDMGPDELNYLIKRFKTEIFNLHSNLAGTSRHDHEINYDYGIIKNKIYIENTEFVPAEEELNNYAGLCIDFSHWENFKLDPSLNYLDDELKILAEKYKIGCSHISAVLKKPRPKMSETDTLTLTDHFLNDMSELDYIKNYKKYIPAILSIELENSFKEQLKVKEYLEEIING